MRPTEHMKHDGRRALHIIAWLLLWGALALLVAHYMQQPVVWRLDVGSANDSPFVQNFFPPEVSDDSPFRWSGPGSRVLLHHLPHGPVRIRLRLNGEFLARTDDATLSLRRGTHVVAFPVQPGWRHYYTLLPSLDDNDTNVLALQSRFTNVGGEDGRLLGVPITTVEVRSLPTPVWPRALWSAMILIGSVSLVLMLATWGNTIGVWLRQRVHHISPRLSILIVLIFAHGLLFFAPTLFWQSIGGWIVLLLPGILLAVRVLCDAETPLLARGFVGMCGGIAWVALMILILQLLPGPLYGWLVLLVCDAMILLLLRSIPTHHPTHTWEFTSSTSIALMLLLLVGGSVRFIHLGSAEFQGDEGLAIVAAVGVHHGQDDVLLLRPKGPVEVTLPAATMTLHGRINEWTARLPFAVAGLMVVIGGVVFASTMFGGKWIPLFVGAVLMLDGMLVAYSRIVQYQSIVLLMSSGALWCCWRFAAQQHHQWRFLVGAALFAGVGVLAHYDGAFVVPTLAWLVFLGGWRRKWRIWAWVRGMSVPVVIGGALVGSFYLPMLQHDHFALKTASYLEWRIGQGESLTRLFHNLSGYAPQATFYSPVVFIVSVVAVLLIGISIWLIRFVPMRIGWAMVAMLMAGVGISIWAPAWFLIDSGESWAIIPFSVPLLAIIFAPATPIVVRTLILWFGVPFVAMSFLIEVPNTHYYTVDVAAALLVGLAMHTLWTWLEQQGIQWGRALLALMSIVVFVLTLPYLVLVYVRQEPEYQRTFPAARPAIYRASYGDSLPDGGYFGFPHRDGWKVVGELYRTGILTGSYTSNQKERMTGWYLRGAPRCAIEPEYVFVARRQAALVPPEYHLWGFVLVDDVRALDIYHTIPVSQPAEFDLAAFADAFDAQEITDFPRQRTLDAIAPQVVVNLAWSEGVVLHGYDLYPRSLTDGRMTTVTLLWHTASTHNHDVPAVLVEMVNAGGMVAGHGMALCGGEPQAVAPGWWAQSFQVGGELAAGNYTLRIRGHDAQFETVPIWVAP